MACIINAMFCCVCKIVQIIFLKEFIEEKNTTGKLRTTKKSDHGLHRKNIRLTSRRPIAMTKENTKAEKWQINLIESKF